MTGELGGAGDIVTGALVGRAVEPQAGEHKGQDHGHDGKCLNCGAALVGAYCHVCGQPEHIHRSLGAIWHDIAHGVLHFEGKIWRTLPLLAFNPGKLTRRYILGERARFVSPMALFLFSIFLMFGIISLLGSHLETSTGVNEGVAREAAQELETQKRDFEKELATLDAKIAAIESQGGKAGELRRERANVSGIKRILEGGPTVVADRGKFLDGFNTGWKRLDKGIAKANENPNLLLYKLQSNAYKFSWLLIPISVPFVWLLFFWQRRWHFYDHTIFVTYSLSFMTLLSALGIVLGAIGIRSDVLFIAFCTIAPVHIYVQLKQAYEQTTAKAIVRTFFLLTFTGITISFFIVLLIALGLVG